MAAKKKGKKKSAKKATRNRSTSAKKSIRKRAKAKSPAKKKVAPKKRAKRSSPKKKQASPKKTRRAGSGSPAFPAARARVTSGGQSGDLQGLSNAERADSESVDELLEEGNALEAGVVKGVEDADNADEQEVRTHEVPEDDVPEEYLNRD